VNVIRHNSSHQNECYSGTAFWSRKKKLEKLNKCLFCLQEREADVKEAIDDLNE
jgi:hypothetical protein